LTIFKEKKGYHDLVNEILFTRRRTRREKREEKMRMRMRMRGENERRE
jgi:hypothetical protein